MPPSGAVVKVAVQLMKSVLVNAPKVPDGAVTSAAAKPLTASLKVTVTEAVSDVD